MDAVHTATSSHLQHVPCMLAVQAVAAFKMAAQLDARAAVSGLDTIKQLVVLLKEREAAVRSPHPCQTH